MRGIALNLAVIGLLAAGAGEAGAETLLDRSGNGNGHAWPSQDFAAPDDAYDTEIADNFSVPFGERWQLTSVRASGSGGTATTARVTVYGPSANTGPGAILFTGEASATPPDYELSLAGIPPLEGGPFYWISIQAVGGSRSQAWGWNQRNDSHGTGPLYRNPGNGYGTNCTSFGRIGYCVGQDGDMQYVLFGDRLTEPAPPSSDFTIKRPERDEKKGTAQLPIKVSDPGELTLRGPKLNSASDSAAAGETVRLPVVPRPKARRKLKHDGALKVVGTVMFVPTGGAGASKAFELELKRSA